MPANEVRQFPDRWFIQVCPECNGQVTGGPGDFGLHNETCPNRHRIFAARSIEVVPASPKLTEALRKVNGPDFAEVIQPLPASTKPFSTSPAVPQGTEGERERLIKAWQHGHFIAEGRENAEQVLLLAEEFADSILAAPSPEPQGDDGERAEPWEIYLEFCPRCGSCLTLHAGDCGCECPPRPVERVYNAYPAAAPQPQGEREAEATADHGEFAAVLATLPLDKWEAIVRKSADRWLAEQAAASESESKDAPASTPEEER